MLKTRILTAIVLGADFICRMGIANPDGAAKFILTCLQADEYADERQPQKQHRTCSLKRCI